MFRDEKVNLHPVIIEHLRKLNHFDSAVFPSNCGQRRLYEQFAMIQETAGARLPCMEKHKHTRSCYVYGFHDNRRAFATMSATRLTPDALQKLMQHRAYQTTQAYINMARQIDQAVANLHVPDVARPKLATGGEGINTSAKRYGGFMAGQRSFKTSGIAVSHWPRWDSNPYAPYGAGDFKSFTYASY